MTIAPYLLNCRGRLLDLTTPAVMGILNITPDSFFAASRHQQMADIVTAAGKMLADGAAILDIGGVSTRPGAAEVSEQEELDRVIPAIQAIVAEFPEAVISVDTWRAGVARASVEAGAALVNDISGGQFDDQMFRTVADLRVPYILMHTKGTPQNMQINPVYDDIVTEVLDYFMLRVNQLRMLGVKDIVLDPGFGFGKTIEHNYYLLHRIGQMEQITGLPVLAGISRKSMIYKYLQITPEESLSATAALHMAALERGARILRVHDVRAAVEVVQLWKMLK